jgi:plasmid maintenance system antidote protein VapI
MEHPLRAYRAEKQLSLKDLAGLLDVTEAQVSRIELEKRPVTAEMAVKIEEKTGGAVPRQVLRPDLWPNIEPSVAAQ